MRGTEEGGLAGEGAALAPVLRRGVRGGPSGGIALPRRDLARKVFLGGKGVESRSLSGRGERARPSGRGSPPAVPTPARPAAAGPAPHLSVGWGDPGTMAFRRGPRPPGAVALQPPRPAELCCIHPPNRAGFFFLPLPPRTGVAF